MSPVTTEAPKKKTTPAAAAQAEPAAAAAPAPAAKKAKPKPAVQPAVKAPKAKLVRDSFTIPKAEYTAIDALKQRGAGLGQAVKKSELLRAGLMALSGMNDKAFTSALQAVPTIKTGRPKQQPEAAKPG